MFTQSAISRTPRSAISLCAAALISALAALAASPTSAQSSEKDYATIGGWTIVESFAQICRLTAPERDDVRLTITKGGGEVGYMSLRAIGSSRPQRPGYVTFAFDDEVVPGSLFGGSNYAPSISDEMIIERFRSASTMEVRVDDKARFTVSLKGSAAAYRSLVQCASRWPESTVPLVPPPPPMLFLERQIPDPNLEGPFAANRETSPIRSDLWFSKGAIPIYADDTGSTTVGVFVSVSASGKPTRCEVSEASDVETINERVCGIIMDRAKFNPATNAEGSPVASTFSTSVTF